MTTPDRPECSGDPAREARCPICDWPFAVDRAHGCVPGDCSYRPDHPAERERIRKRREALAAAPPKPAPDAMRPDAWQWPGGMLQESAPDWVAEATEPTASGLAAPTLTGGLTVWTSRGKQKAHPRDWIARIDGEVYLFSAPAWTALSAPVPSPDGAIEIGRGLFRGTVAGMDCGDHEPVVIYRTASGSLSVRSVEDFDNRNRETLLLSDAEPAPSPPATGAAEPDAVLAAEIARWENDPRVLYPDNEVLESLDRIKTASAPTPGLSITQMERAAKACRDKYCELMSGEKAWADLTKDERGILMVSLSAAFSAVSFVPAVGVTREAIARVIFENAVGLSKWDNEFYSEERDGCFRTADAILALSAPDATVSAEPWPDHPGATVAAVAFIEANKRFPQIDRDSVTDLSYADRQADRMGAFIDGFNRAMQMRVHVPPQDVGREATIEECKTIALEQRCAPKTDWDLACKTIAEKIGVLSRNGGGRG